MSGKEIRYIKEFVTRTEQEKLMLHLLRIGTDFDHGIKKRSNTLLRKSILLKRKLQD